MRARTRDHRGPRRFGASLSGQRRRWSMTLFVGTSGWAYKEWRDGFYPVDLPERRFLEHYSGVLSACEINATFYRLQTKDTFTRWVEMTREGFRFAVKAHRRLTH